MPDAVDAYTHRIGRTSRTVKIGAAFTFAEPADEVMVRKIEAVLCTPIERLCLPGSEYHGFVPKNRPQGSGRHQMGRTGSDSKHSHVRSNNGKSNGTRAQRRRRQRNL